MTILQLRLSPAPRAVRPAVAWLVPGAEPLAWLNEVARWGVPQREIALHPIPDERDGFAGVLVLVPGAATPTVSPGVLPLGVCAGRLFVPVDGLLDPPVADDELQSLLDRDREYLLHPVLGFVAFEREDRLGLADLLRPGPSAATRWNLAVASEPVNDRLHSIGLSSPPTLEDIFRPGREDIGTEPLREQDLPPAPNEPGGNPLRRAAEEIRKGLARAAKWLTGQAPHNAPRRTWLNDLEDWANRQLSGGPVSRMRELARLLHLLETDPDRGLRHAISLTGGANRGAVPPRDHLPEHDTDFNLSRLGGGGPGEYWEAPADYRERLIARYSELAAREQRLGRHRRAAYIYAELLGDLASAVAALKAGHHWREAAVLLEQRLGRPLEAAECLEQGGFYADALSLYQECNEFEKAGDLHTRLTQHDEAKTAYGHAVQYLLRRGHRVEAARVAEDKLHTPDRARELLEEGWPRGEQAKYCLQALFGLLARHERHDETRRLLGRLRDQALSGEQGLALVEILSAGAAVYPDAEVKKLAADTARVRIAAVLPEAPPTETRTLLNCLARLTPEDRLLERDCERYQRAKPSPRPTVTGRRQLKTIGQARFPQGMQLAAAVATGNLVYVAGWERQRLGVACCNADGRVQVGLHQWPATEWRGLRAPVLMAATPHNEAFLLLHQVGDGPLPPEELPATGWAPATALGGGAGMPHLTIGAARSLGRSWYLGHGDMPYVVAVANNELVNRMPLPSSALGETGWSPIPVPMAALRRSAFIGLGKALLAVEGAVRHAEELPSVVQSLAVSPWHGQRDRVAIGMTSGAAVWWRIGSRLELFAKETSNALVALLRSGHVVVAGDDTLALYSTREGRVDWVLETRLDRRPLAVLALRTPSHFAVVYPDGLVTFHEVPG